MTTAQKSTGAMLAARPSGFPAEVRHGDGPESATAPEPAQRVRELEHEQGRIAEALGCAPDADLVEEARLVMARLANADAARAELQDEAGNLREAHESAAVRATLAEHQLRLVGFALQTAGIKGSGPVEQAKEAAHELGRMRAKLKRAVAANVAILEAAKGERR